MGTSAPYYANLFTITSNLSPPPTPLGHVHICVNRITSLAMA